jgi:hypothetical protein
MLSAATDAGGIDENEALGAALIYDVNRVARCPRQLADNGALTLDDRVD